MSNKKSRAKQAAGALTGDRHLKNEDRPEEATGSATEAGTNEVRFEGLLSKHSKLRPGRYTLLVTATVSGKRSTTRTLQFMIANG
jgi:hypothetical protein